MKKYLLPFLLFVAAFAACDNDVERDNEEIAEEQNRYDYPETIIIEHEDNYHGTKVKDPYRWMERIESDTVADWVKRQNQFSESYFDTIDLRGKIKSRLEELHNYPKQSAPQKAGGKYFFSKNDGLQNQSVLYVSDTLGGEGEVFLDPNKLSDKGTVALQGYEVSQDGKYLAYSLAEAGSDWNTIRVMRVDDKKLLDDEVKWVKFSGIAWKDDGFYYTRFPKPEEGKAISTKNLDAKIYYHKLGTPQSKDKIAYEDPEHPKRYFYAATVSKEKYLAVMASEGTYGSAVYIKNLQKPNSQFVKLVDNFNNEFGIVGGDGDNIYLHTDKDAPRWRVVKVNMANNSPQMETVIGQQEDMVLQGASLAGGHILTTWQKDATSVLHVYNLKGEKLHKVELPTLGSVSGFGGKNEDTVIFFTFQSFVYPSTVFQYDISKNELKEYYKSQIKFDKEKYETKQVFYQSKDGTKIPMFITHKKGIELNGKNPTLLYGYGGFNISINPSFGSPSKLVFLENGGVFAVANLRGGGEYGEDWHKGGMLEKKQNVFDDFIAAAEYLISEKYTNRKKLAISGRSNGGLLVGACMVQRPELFKVALPAVGVLDMLRYQHFSIGRAWAVEYGQSEDSAQFQYLYKYSPYHNIDSACYPATMVTTGDHDDRVVPAHSYKFAAQLQRHQTCSNPIVIRIETDAGHGAGKPISKLIEEDVDIYTFMFQNLGMKME